VAALCLAAAARPVCWPRGGAELGPRGRIPAPSLWFVRVGACERQRTEWAPSGCGGAARASVCVRAPHSRWWAGGRTVGRAGGNRGAARCGAERPAGAVRVYRLWLSAGQCTASTTGPSTALPRDGGGRRARKAGARALPSTGSASDPSTGSLPAAQPAPVSRYPRGVPAVAGFGTRRPRLGLRRGAVAGRRGHLGARGLALLPAPCRLSVVCDVPRKGFATLGRRPRWRRRGPTGAL
jgi:hypothetical protein